MAARPTLIYDEGCGFCRRVAGYAARRAGPRWDYVPRSDAGRSLPQVSSEATARSVVFVDGEGRLHRGAAAVFKGSAELGLTTPWRLYRASPLFAWASETAYRFVAYVRPFLSFLLDALLGPPSDPA